MMHRMGEPSQNHAGPPRWRKVAWAMLGLTLIGLFIALFGIAPRFERDAPDSSPPIALAIVIWASAGGVYLASLMLLWRSPPIGWRGVLWIGLVGLAIRALMFFSPTVFEADHHRYLWDGAVVAQGISPYLWSPMQAREGIAPQPLVELAEQAPGEPSILYRIDAPWHHSKSPPVAGLAFAVAHRIAPWHPLSLRGLFLAFDTLAAVMIALALVRLGRPVEWVAVYWWCPITAKAFINGIHFDPIVIGLAMTAVVLLLHRWIVLAYAMLALAIGAKLWPALLIPLFLRYTWPNRRATAIGLVGLLSLSALMFVPYILQQQGEASGLLRYLSPGQANAAHVQPLGDLWRWLCGVFGWPTRHAPYLVRLTLGAAVGLWILWLSARPIRDGHELIWRCLLAVGGLFLLSPVQAPWYYGWVLALLALRPWWPLLAYAVLLPLHHATDLHPQAVWLVHAPVWVMLIADYAYCHRAAAHPHSAARAPLQS